MTAPQFEEGTTLDRFLMESLRATPGATGQFVNLMQSIALAGKMISSRVNRAGLAGMLGGTGDVNIQGEFVQKLDRYANEVFLKALEHRGHTCMVVSEEEGGVVRVPEQWHSGRYVVTVDPLDGSSNIDVNATIGTIFGVFRRVTPEGSPATDADGLRPGKELSAAGYIIYGSGTVLVLATEFGVHGFTLDPSVGEFFLSHRDIRTPDRAKIYSCNEAYSEKWAPGVRAFIARCKEPDRKMSARYIGSLVADFHRNLLKGGVFLYPATESTPEGKLRLLYEGFPLAYIAEMAGGAATNGKQRILDVVPDELHARTPLVIGSRLDVEEATALMASDAF
ncbi:MAG: class 1 fructose-bisphosphatase [Deltaproteobacteria bacterium]|nr:MAG: class 1 fructose-bisphosphatase [Deltaproteobacteria bacterium]